MDNLPVKGYAKQSEVVLTGKPGIFNIMVYTTQVSQAGLGGI